MKRLSVLVFGQALLCLLATYLISRISLIGKIGIALFYKEYRVFRSSWKTFALFFATQLIIIGVLWMIRNKLTKAALRYTAWALLLTGVIALWATYYDFQHTYSHRLLKERFHLGFYLFWLGWIGSCVFFLVIPTRTDPILPARVDQNAGPV